VLATERTQWAKWMLFFQNPTSRIPWCTRFVLPAVRTSFTHSNASRLRDCMMLMPASSSTKNQHNPAKIEQFSTKNAGNLKQKSDFFKFFISFPKNDLQTTSHKIRLNFRIKHAGSSNYRGAVFSSLTNCFEFQ